MAGSATFTTVESRNAMPDPRTVVASTNRAIGVPTLTPGSMGRA